MASSLRYASLAAALSIAMAFASPTNARPQDAANMTAADAVAVADAAREADLKTEATAILDEMDAGKFDAVHARFTAEMAAAISADQLKQIWTTLPGQLGAAQGRGDMQVRTRDGTTFVTLPLRYEHATINAIFAFEADGKVSGLLLKPQDAPKEAAPPVPAGAHYREIELKIGDDATALPATLALPDGKGPFPAIVLVHGSGPQDRDETIGANRPFLDIARGLAERGIAVLRYEKRTKARPQDYAQGVTIDNETTDDAVLALAALRAQAKIDRKRVFVLGHSQGGMMAPRIAAHDPAVAGLVLLAAPARSLLDILIEQNRRLAYLDDGHLSDAESQQIMRVTDAVKTIREGGEPSADHALMGLPAAYWRTIDAVDPVAEAAKLNQPMLFLQGARDIQVVDADWQAWKGAFGNDPRATFKLYEALNHLAIPGEGPGSLQEYQTPGHVLPALIDDIAAWIARNGKPAVKRSK